MYIISTWKLRDATSTATLLPYVSSIKGLLDTHNITGKVYEKDSHTLSEDIKLVEKLNMAQQVTAILSSPIANIMPSDYRCFVCGKKGHFGYYCPDAQCYNCAGFGHFTQDCPENISPSETPHHCDRSHSHSCHSCNSRDMSYSFHSCNYSTDHNWSSSRHSSDTTHRLHMKRTLNLQLQPAIPYRLQCQKEVTIQNSQSDSSSE